MPRCGGAARSSSVSRRISPSETTTFILSLEQTLFDRFREGFAGDPAKLAQATWSASTLLDALGQYTTELAHRGRDQVIIRQQQELLELSTPVVTLWHGVLALPIIGTLDRRACAGRDGEPAPADCR